LWGRQSWLQAVFWAASTTNISKFFLEGLTNIMKLILARGKNTRRRTAQNPHISRFSPYLNRREISFTSPRTALHFYPLALPLERHLDTLANLRCKAAF
jgi:hypothetical protein